MDDNLFFRNSIVSVKTYSLAFYAGYRDSRSRLQKIVRLIQVLLRAIIVVGTFFNFTALFSGHFMLTDSCLQVLHVLGFLNVQVQFCLHIVLWNHSNTLISLAHLKKSLQANSMVYRSSDHPQETLNFRNSGLVEIRARQKRLQLNFTVNHLKSMELCING